MLTTLGPLYKSASHVDEEYIHTCFPKASTWKTALHLVERSGWCSVEMSLCLQWTQGNCEITAGAGKGLKRAWYMGGSVAIPDKGHFFSKFHCHFDFQSSIPCLKLSFAKCCILHSRQGFVVPDNGLLKKLKNYMGKTLLNNKVML